MTEQEAYTEIIAQASTEFNTTYVMVFPKAIEAYDAVSQCEPLTAGRGPLIRKTRGEIAFDGGRGRVIFRSGDNCSWAIGARFTSIYLSTRLSAKQHDNIIGLAMPAFNNGRITYFS